MYVSGEFPKGMKWKGNIGDAYIRKIKTAGGKVVIVPHDYSSVDLEHAKTECADTPTTSLSKTRFSSRSASSAALRSVMSTFTPTMRKGSVERLQH